MSENKNADNITIETIQNAVESVFKDSYVFIVLMGSAATERFHKESDIDLAIYLKKIEATIDNTIAGKKSAVDAVFRKTIELENILGRDCDLVILNDCDPIFCRQVLESGRLLLITDDSAFNIWKAEQMSRYPDFKYSRIVIENNLLNRKKYV